MVSRLKQHRWSHDQCLIGIFFLFCLLAHSFAYAQSTNSTETIPDLKSAECPTEALNALNAECYTFYGEENWDNPNGNIIQAPVAVIKPETGGSDKAPVFFFPGGPGYSSLNNLDYLKQLRKDIGERTLVTMDHRGYIHADPALECPEYAQVSPYHNVVHTPALTSSLDPMVRLESITSAVEDCYHKLSEEGIDVAQYNQYSVSRDVDEIRRLLGYDTIDIFGSSTGSGTALSFIQYHPDSVRAAIFGWPWFAHLRNRPPVDEFYTAKQTFNDVLALCVADDPACRDMLPAWLLSIDRARITLDERPFIASVEESDGSEKTLYFDGAAFLDTLYLYLPSVYAELPSLLADIQAGDYSRLNDFFLIDDYDPEPEAPNYALGYFLAHVCNDMGGNRPTRQESTAAVQREPAILGFEPPWLCGWWADGDVPLEHNDPPSSDIPALSIHGQMDPCCGTRWSEQLKKTMPNLQFVAYQGLGHSPVNECRSTMVNAFLNDPHAKIDDSCKDEVALTPWVLEPPK